MISTFLYCFCCSSRKIPNFIIIVRCIDRQLCYCPLPVCLRIVQSKCLPSRTAPFAHAGHRAYSVSKLHGHTWRRRASTSYTYTCRFVYVRQIIIENKTIFIFNYNVVWNSYELRWHFMHGINSIPSKVTKLASSFSWIDFNYFIISFLTMAQPQQSKHPTNRYIVFVFVGIHIMWYLIFQQQEGHQRLLFIGPYSIA